MNPPRSEDPLEPHLLALYRAASPAKKLDAIARLNAGVIGLKEAALKAIHPTWTADLHRAALRRWWFGSRD